MIMQPTNGQPNMAQAPGQPSPQMPQPAAAPQAIPAQNNGPMPVDNVEFSQDIQNVLWSRIQQLQPEELEVLDIIVTPETFPILVKIFPEMKVLFEQASMFGGEEMGGGPIQGAPMQQEEPQNPLASDERISRGLMG